ARCGDLAVGEDRGVGYRDGITLGGKQRGQTERAQAARAIVEQVSDCLIGDLPREAPRKCTEVSVTLGLVGYVELGAGNALFDATSFVREEEEGAVLLDRPAERSAKLILLELRFDDVEVALGVQHTVAKKFKSVAVKFVGTRLGDDVDDGSGVAAIL